MTEEQRLSPSHSAPPARPVRPPSAVPAPAAVRPRRPSVPLLPYLLILPTALWVLVFTLLPTLSTVYSSFFRQNQAVRVPRFIGLDNYAYLATDDIFRKVLGNTVLFIVGTVPLNILFAFLLALVLNRKLRGIGFLRLSFFYPNVLPMVSAATIWLFMYTPGYGLVNAGLQAIGLSSLNWLGDDNLALWAIVIMAIWKQVGYYMIFYLAGLQGLSQDYYEASDLDGATWWQQIRYITWPLLTGTTVFVATIAVVNAFQTVDQLYIMTQGGPNNASNLLLFQIYETQFRFQNLGLANTMTVILVIVLLIFTLLNLRLGERNEVEG